MIMVAEQSLCQWQKSVMPLTLNLLIKGLARACCCCRKRHARSRASQSKSVEQGTAGMGG